MKKLMSCILIISIVIMAACGSGKGNKEERTVRINCHDVYAATTLLVMKEYKILEKYLPENVKVEWVELATGPDIRDAMVSGNLDIADLSLMTFIMGYENKLPLKLVSYMGATPIKVYSNSESINSVSDIGTNDKIAITNKTTTLHAAFLGLCEDKLGDAMIYDNNLSAVPAADALASISNSDDYKAAIFSFPNCSKAEELDNVKLLEDMSDVIEKYSVGAASVSSSEFYDNNKDIIEAYKKAQDDVLNYIEENTDEVSVFLAERFGVSAELVKEVIETMPPSKFVNNYDLQAKLLYDNGILTSEPTKFIELENYDEIPME
ncbi:MAG: ABC transporter substrate-binding protein [Lachnospiraceae bacterium]|nr:ABC transporter substrate-binding protein [Lachnospiraceae bacterium]